MEDIFKKYLDNSQDYDTIKLELENSYNFEQCFEVMDMVDHQDADTLARNHALSYPFIVETNRQMLFDLIREVWDIAYSHGYHDAQADEGINLTEIEE